MLWLLLIIQIESSNIWCCCFGDGDDSDGAISRLMISKKRIRKNNGINSESYGMVDEGRRIANRALKRRIDRWQLNVVPPPVDVSTLVDASNLMIESYSPPESDDDDASSVDAACSLLSHVELAHTSPSEAGSSFSFDRRVDFLKETIFECKDQHGILKGLMMIFFGLSSFHKVNIITSEIVRDCMEKHQIEVGSSNDVDELIDVFLEKLAENYPAFEPLFDLVDFYRYCSSEGGFLADESKTFKYLLKKGIYSKDPRLPHPEGLLQRFVEFFS